MSHTAIKVEGLTKQYVLRQQQASNYTALRDVIAEKARAVLSGKSNKSTKDTFLALDDVSFSITSGDRVGIIGRNGAGKSTLLKVLSRIVSPTKGRITIEGRLASLLEVGTGFHPELTGRENVYLNGSILGMSKTEITKKFDEIVAFAEVERFLDTPVKRYSSGMYVRLAFAVAAHLEPEILIVDEVLAVGDAAFQKKCLGRMKEVAGEGRTVLFVSHNMDAVQRLCNKGILLSKGKLVMEGDINAVTNKYLETFSEGQVWYDIPKPAGAENLAAFATRIQVENLNHDPVQEVRIGEDYFIRLNFIVNKAVEGFVAAIGISTIFDLPIRTTWSLPMNLQPGGYSAIFKNDGLILADNQYKISFGLSIGPRAMHHSTDAGILSVSEVSMLATDPRIINTKSGIIVNQMDVEIIRH
ncbi:MAG: ABC transporter ATP-binding protein [Bacteroidota bacterium]|nr:ABC transporter ATP-binding protein [Bacteroidota bacterium]